MSCVLGRRFQPRAKLRNAISRSGLELHSRRFCCTERAFRSFPRCCCCCGRPTKAAILRSAAAVLRFSIAEISSLKAQREQWTMRENDIRNALSGKRRAWFDDPLVVLCLLNASSSSLRFVEQSYVASLTVVVVVSSSTRHHRFHCLHSQRTKSSASVVSSAKRRKISTRRKKT